MKLPEELAGKFAAAKLHGFNDVSEASMSGFRLMRRILAFASLCRSAMKGGDKATLKSRRRLVTLSARPSG